MRALVALMLCLAGSAWAGENIHLGTMTMTGSSVTNVTTAVPFVIPLNSKITVYCSAAGVQMLTDSFTVSTATLGTKGIQVPGATLFPSSVTKRMSQVSGKDSAVVAMIGTAAITCDFWQRPGGE